MRDEQKGGKTIESGALVWRWHFLWCLFFYFKRYPQVTGYDVA